MKIDNFATVTQSIVMTLLVIAISIITYLFVVEIGIDVENNPGLLWLNIPVFGFVFFLAVRLTNTKVGDYIQIKPVSLFFIMSVVLSFIGLMIIVSECANLVYYLFPVPEEFIEMIDTVGSNNIGILAAVIVAPLTEEFFFRGLLLRGLINNYSVRYSIIVSALLFGAMHLNIWQMIPAILIGLYFGWIYLLSGNIWIVLILHAIQNISSYLLEMNEIFIPGLIYPIADGVQFQSIWLDLFGTALFMMGYLLLKNYELTTSPMQDLKKIERNRNEKSI